MASRATLIFGNINAGLVLINAILEVLSITVEAGWAGKRRR
jgi:hypothetical protein